jgi:hypothetical protein
VVGIEQILVIWPSGHQKEEQLEMHSSHVQLQDVMAVPWYVVLVETPSLSYSYLVHAYY